MAMNPANAQRAWVLPWKSGWVTSVAFAGDNNRVVAGNEFGQFLQWDLPKELPGKDALKASTESDARAPVVQPSRQLVGHQNCISRILPTSDGRLVTTSWDHTVRVWKIDGPTEGEAELVFQEKLKKRPGKKPINDSDQADKSDPAVKIPVQKDVGVLLTRSEWVRSASFDANRKQLLVGDDSGAIVLWDLAAGKPLKEMKGGGWIRSVALSPDGNRAVTTEYAIRYSQFPPMIRLWDTTSGQEIKDWSKQIGTQRKNPGINAATFSPDGKQVALAKGGEDGGGPIYLIETETGKVLWQDKGHENGATQVAFSSDGKFVLSSGRDTTVRIYTAADGKLVTSIGKPRGGQFKDWIHDFALSADETRLVTADIAGMVHVWTL